MFSRGVRQQGGTARRDNKEALAGSLLYVILEGKDPFARRWLRGWLPYQSNALAGFLAELAVA